MFKHNIRKEVKNEKEKAHAGYAPVSIVTSVRMQFKKQQ